MKGNVLETLAGMAVLAIAGIILSYAYQESKR